MLREQPMRAFDFRAEEQIYIEPVENAWKLTGLKIQEEVRL
ncbi:MAG: hypothetical protein OER85_09860 [Gammaproteobacteria bacterium]|nr:hypothetical protein [Gammaproteobacteria bacterium]